MKPRGCEVEDQGPVELLVESEIEGIERAAGVAEARLRVRDARALIAHPDGRRIGYLAGDSAYELWVLENFLPAN